MIITKHVNTEPCPLPWKIVEEIDPLAIYVTLFEALIKKHALNILNGKTSDMNEQLRKYVGIIDLQAYNRGLAHMDRMHYETDKKEV